MRPRMSIPVRTGRSVIALTEANPPVERTNRRFGLELVIARGRGAEQAGARRAAEQLAMLREDLASAEAALVLIEEAAPALCRYRCTEQGAGRAGAADERPVAHRRR